MEKTIKKEGNIMGTMPVGKLLFTMAMPMVISMLVQALYNIYDSLVVASYSPDGVTGLALAFPLQSLMIAFATGTGVGINSYLSKSLGEGRRDRANKAVTNGLFLILLINIAFIILGLTCTDLYFKYLTDAAPGSASYDYGTGYTFIVLVFSTGLFFQVTFERLLQSTGMAKMSMVTQGVGAVVNIILDPFFILAKGDRFLGITMPFGFDMGTEGAALATVIGQFLAAVLGLILNLIYNKDISLSFKKFKPDLEVIGKICSVGIPSIFMSAVGSFLTVALNKILTIGEAASYAATGIPAAKATLLAQKRLAGVAVYGVYFKLQSFVFMPVFGMNNGMIPIVAYNFGMRSKARIMKTVKLAMIAAFCYMLLGFCIFQTFSGPLIEVFYQSDNSSSGESADVRTEEDPIFTEEELEALDQDARELARMSGGEAVMHYGKPAMRIISFCFIFAGVCVITISALQALGQGLPSLLISLIRQIVIILPLAFIFAKTFGLLAVFFAFPIAEFVALIISIFLFIRTYKKQIKPLDLPLAEGNL